MHGVNYRVHCFKKEKKFICMLELCSRAQIQLGILAFVFLSFYAAKDIFKLLGTSVIILGHCVPLPCKLTPK